MYKKTIISLSVLLLMAGCVSNNETKIAANENALAKGESYPAYYNDLDRIVLKDVMTRWYTVNKTGILSYGLEDAAKNAGHVCPAVTGAYLMTRAALNAIKAEYEANPKPSETSTYDYEDKVLYRGGVKITMSGAENKGNGANAMANVMSGITGAQMESGFKGGPGYPFANRQNLLTYDSNLKFSPSKGIEAIFTSMKATYVKKDAASKETSPATYAECKGTKKKCIEKTTCDFSVKVTYKFLDTSKYSPYSAKINHIVDNYEDSLTIEKVANPASLCSK